MLGMTSATSATVPAEFSIVIMTAVLAPGAGLIVPVITISWRPEYDGASVRRVIE
jgi:hypothetical protein